MKEVERLSAPDGLLPIYQHWPGSWRVAEGTWRWAGSIGFRAVAVESQDHFEGPPTRPALRQQFFRRDAQLHGTGELVSWAKGRELAHLGLDKVERAIAREFAAFVEGSHSDEDTERAVCDLFMAARCGDYLDRLLDRIRRGVCVGWKGAIRRALEFELVTKSPNQLLHSREFWRTGVMPELVSAMPQGSWANGLRWQGFYQDVELQFGQLVLWSAGACGQMLREAIQVDWTDTVLEQGAVQAIAGRDHLSPWDQTFTRWLLRPLGWRHRRFEPSKPLRTSRMVSAINLLHERAPELGEVGWRVGPNHWARIVEWVLVWRRELHRPEMLERARTLALLLLLDDSPNGTGSDFFPAELKGCSHVTPRAVGDRPERLVWELDWTHPHDFRLEDELYPAIAAAVAAWLRGAGLAACGGDVFTKAPWLAELIRHKRIRMCWVLKFAAEYARPRLEEIGLSGADADELERFLVKRTGISLANFRGWQASQALPSSFLADFAEQLAETRLFPLQLQQNIVERTASQGTGCAGGIDNDLRWGLSCVAERMRSLLLKHDVPRPKSCPSDRSAERSHPIACA